MFNHSCAPNMDLLFLATVTEANSHSEMFEETRSDTNDRNEIDTIGNVRAASLRCESIPIHFVATSPVAVGGSLA
jgi:hypothetical protein